jgi:hypothetical protein
VQNTVGLAFARHGQFAPAVAALRRAVALALAPERAQLLNNLGYALLLDGHTEDARAMLRLTLAVNPSHEAALRNLAFIDQQMPAVAGKAAPQMAAVVDTPALPPTAIPTAAVTVLPTAALAAATPTEPATASAPATASGTAPTQASIAPEPNAAHGVAHKTEGKTEALAHAQLQGVSIEIVNGNGINGAAARLRLSLREQGIEAGRLANLPPYKSAHTLVLHRPGKADEAREVADHMPVDAGVALAPAGSTRADLRVVIGHDVRHSASCAALAACATPERLASSVDWAGHGPAVEEKVRR